MVYKIEFLDILKTNKYILTTSKKTLLIVLYFNSRGTFIFLKEFICFPFWKGELNSSFILFVIYIHMQKWVTIWYIVNILIDIFIWQKRFIVLFCVLDSEYISLKKYCLSFYSVYSLKGKYLFVYLIYICCVMLAFVYND